LATEALAAPASGLFEQRALHPVFAEADGRSGPVHRLLERLGFRCEARLVEADWFKGEWSTLRAYEILTANMAASAHFERLERDDKNCRCAVDLPRPTRSVASV
jgi:hypothetical protein